MEQEEQAVLLYLLVQLALAVLEDFLVIPLEIMALMDILVVAVLVAEH